MTPEQLDAELDKHRESKKIMETMPAWAQGMKDPERLMDIARDSSLKWVGERISALNAIKDAIVKIKEGK